MKRPIKILSHWGLANNARRFAVTFTLAKDLNIVFDPIELREVVTSSIANMVAESGVSDNDIYRVCIPFGTRVAEVMCIGLESVDNELEGIYDDLDELPTWVQESVAVLSMLPIDKPNQQVAGVGRRIAENIYWVYKLTM